MGAHCRRVSRPVAFAALVCTVATNSFADGPDIKPREVALGSLLDETDRPPTNGVQLKTTKAEVVERDKNAILRVHWVIEYSGKRWPLVILEPSMTRKTNGQTRITFFAKGKSGKSYALTAWSEQTIGELDVARPELDWFLEVRKETGKAKGVMEFDLGQAKDRFVQGQPKEFSADIIPELYVRMQHWPRDRGRDLDLDAWTGPLIARPIKVSAKNW